MASGKVICEECGFETMTSISDDARRQGKTEINIPRWSEMCLARRDEEPFHCVNLKAAIEKTRHFLEHDIDG